MRAGCCPQWLRGRAEPKPSRCPWWRQQGRAGSRGTGSSTLAPQHPDWGGLGSGGSPRLWAAAGSLSEVDNSCPWVFLSQTLTKAFMQRLAECT